jgi:arylsulfatase A-like enzyme
MKKKTVLIALAALVVFAAALAWVLLRSRSADDAAPYNLLVITLDTTRADRLGCYGDRAARTPALDALAREGIVFENCYTPVPVTLPAHCSLFSGRWPVAHGVRNNGSYKLAESELTLAEKLKADGYDTAALVAVYVLKGKFGLAQGFDLYDDRLGLEEKAGNVDAQIPADRVYAKFSEWLDRKSDRPFFLWTHFYDPHKPYAPPADYLRAAAGDAYRGEVAYMDFHIGRMIADLKERGLFERTLIVVAGDHGEGFGEHGEKGHGIFCYEESVRVPLILCNKALLKQPARVSARANLVDVVPTVEELLGLDRTPGVQGVSLAAQARGGHDIPPRALYLETLYGYELNNWAPLTGLISGSYKYLSLPQAELYDLAADPAEKVNLFFKKNPLARSLDRELAQFVRAHQGRSAPDGTAALDADERKKLAALGYVSSFAASGSGPAGIDPKQGIAIQNRYTELVAALDRGEVAQVEAEALRLRDETAALKLPYTYLMLHYVYSKKQQWAKVEANLLHACDVFKDSPTQALTFRGNLLEFYMDVNDLNAAEKLATEMTRIYPNRTRALEILGEISEKRKDWPGALAWYDRAHEIEAGNITLAKKAITMQIKTGANREALARSEALLKSLEGADDADLLYTAAMLAADAGDGAGSERHMRRLSELQPTAQRFFDYAIILGRNGKFAEALAAMEKALAITPSDLDREGLDAAATALRVWRERRR